ncbi:RsmE family RNA methyltransferase [bacterium]|nr:RsmE family RNA methyltransferase [bacterium]
MIHLVKERLNISGELLIPDEADLHYLVKVRRIRSKERISFASAGEVFETECELSGKDAVFKIINKYSDLRSEPKLFAALASADVSAIEECLRNGVEAGADAFFIFRSDYSNTDMKFIEKKMPRFKTIVASAASQSRRTFLPEITLKPLEELASMDCEHIVLHPYSPINLNSYLCNNKKDKMLWIGAEGGFSEREEAFFEGKNFKMFSLKTPILRMENAVTATLAFVRNLINLQSGE